MRWAWRHTLGVAGVLLAACGSPEPSAHPTRATLAETTLPPLKSFSAARPAPTLRSNAAIAQDFLDLSFALESGRELPRFTRFEGPISVKLTGRSTATLRNDLNQLLARLRNEAGINIRLVSEGSAQITIQSVAKRDIRRALPHAACFVVPNVNSIAEYRRSRNAPRTDWAGLEIREQIAIFLPYDTSPQDVRDCLHEELAQALGPLNDLYRLNDSVFNDDNFHTVLTSFDMLILRAHYDQALSNGMSRDQVAQRLPSILARLNPRGVSAGTASDSQTPDSWKAHIQSALGPNTTSSKRVDYARQAIEIASNLGWTDHRRGFSHYAYARLLQSHYPEAAHSHYLQADRYFTLSAPNGPHRSTVSAHLAAHALSTGDPRRALKIIDRNLPNARAFENAIVLSSLLMLKAEALDALGRSNEAQAARLDSLGWARYGFGPDWAVRAKLREVASLNPNNRSF